VQGIAAYPQGHLWTAWRWLLQNHPHDSIGGCSVDAIHRQMATRFEWATEIADYLTEERFRLLARQLDLSAVHDDELALVVFNASPWNRDEVISVDIDLPESWLLRQAAARVTPITITAESPFRDVYHGRLDSSGPGILRWSRTPSFAGFTCDPQTARRSRFRSRA
jgi:hypothetical protein